MDKQQAILTSGGVCYTVSHWTVAALKTACSLHDTCHGCRVHLHYDSKLEGLSMDKQQATFISGGNLQTVNYDLLVAADGRYSKACRLIAEQVSPILSLARALLLQLAILMTGTQAEHS